MSKKDKIKTIEVDDVNLVPELLDGNHRVIPIVTGGDEPVEEVEVPEIIPILTLRSSVLFPGAITPITVGRDKSINLVRAVNAEGGILGAVLQRESDVEDPAPDDMYKVGTSARIIKILEMPNGNLTVILNGLEKVEITDARDNEHLMDLLNNKMQEIPGVTATETLISLEQSIKKEIPICPEK